MKDSGKISKSLRLSCGPFAVWNLWLASISGPKAIGRANSRASPRIRQGVGHVKLLLLYMLFIGSTASGAHGRACFWRFLM
jgi:hypothetical protein